MGNVEIFVFPKVQSSPLSCLSFSATISASREPSTQLLQFVDDTALWVTFRSSAKGSRILSYELGRLQA